MEKEEYYLYVKDNLFLHYNFYSDKYYFEGGFHTASKFFTKEAAQGFQDNWINLTKELQGGQWFLVTSTITYNFSKDMSIKGD